MGLTNCDWMPLYLDTCFQIFVNFGNFQKTLSDNNGLNFPVC